jgi:hypothetical protein
MGIAYESIERKFVEVQKYVSHEWKSIEMLWNLNTEVVCKKLIEDNDITKWGGVLDQIKVGYKTINKSDDYIYFGALHVSFSDV